MACWRTAVLLAMSLIECSAEATPPKHKAPKTTYLTIAEMEGIPLEAEQAMNAKQKKALEAVDWSESVESVNPYTSHPTTYPTAFPTGAPVPTTHPTPGPPTPPPTTAPSSAIFRVKAASATAAGIAVAQTGLVVPAEEAKLEKAKIDRQAALAIAFGMVLTAAIISMTVIYIVRVRSGSTRTVLAKNQEIPLKPQDKPSKLGRFKHLLPRYMRPKKWQKDNTKQHMIHLGAMTEAPTVACL
jgi:hypothetical protein